MSTAVRTASHPALSITSDAVEREIRRLFANTDGPELIIRVQGGRSPTGREDAFRELLESLAMHDRQYRHTQELKVEPPDVDAIRSGISILTQPRLQKQLFEQVLWVFGRGLVEPLATVIDSGPLGTLLEQMKKIRRALLVQVEDLNLTRETAEILGGDLSKLMSDDYLAMLAEHEEKVQRPRVEALARETLHLIATTFQRSFRSWPEHAQRIADAVHHRFGASVNIRENPAVIRARIVEGIGEFLWVETRTELEGSLEQLYRQDHYRHLLSSPRPELDRDLYEEFAEACWELIANNC